VDRKFSAEKFMAFSHLIGGLSMLGLYFIKPIDGLDPKAIEAGTASHPLFWPFFGLMMVHCLFYVPTLSIANTIAFTHLKDAKKDFGIVRMGGTVGWILVAWPFVFILVDWTKVGSFSELGLTKWFGAVFASGKTGAAFQAGVRATFLVSAIISLALSVFSLSLPHTPPKPGKGEKLAWLEAFKLLAKPFVFILFVVTFLDAFVHNLYFAWTATFLENRVGIPGNWVMPVMTIGQVAELLTMAALGLVLSKLGWRTTMIIGILGHAARFAVYAFFPDNQNAIIAVQILHGICYAFFFATLYIFIDEYLPQDIRTSAQGLFNMLVFGFGPLASFYFGPKLLNNYSDANAAVHWEKLFLIPCGAALVAVVLLALFFDPPTAPKKVEGYSPAPH
jgi:hypothetical protein